MIWFASIAKNISKFKKKTSKKFRRILVIEKTEPSIRIQLPGRT